MELEKSWAVHEMWCLVPGDAIAGIWHVDGFEYFNSDFGVTFSAYWEKCLPWFIKEHEINQQLRKRAIFLATVGFIIFCTRGTGNTATAASHHSEADSLNKLAELTFDNDSLNVF